MRAAALVGTLISVLSLVGCDLPADATLIAQFKRSHNDIEHLRQMAEEDDIHGRIHAGYADPKLPQARLDEYRRLMSASGIMRLYANGRQPPLELMVDGTGFLAQGDYKGYLYNPSESARSAASLDDSCFDIAEAKKEERFCSAVRSLGDGWWLVRYEYR